MIAMILAAGFGTRLRPLTSNKSKVALPLAGVPVVVRLIRMLRAAGVTRFVVNLHHAPDTVRQALAAVGEEVQFSPEPEILGTGGALWGAREMLAGERVLLVNGDCYYDDPDLTGAMRFHERNGSLATMALIGMPAGESYRGVEIDSSSRLLRVAGRPEGGPSGGEVLHFPGIHILEPEFIGRIGPGFSDINSQHYPELIRAGAPVFGWRTSFGWHDLGTPRRFLSAASELIARETGAGSPREAVMLGQGCAIARSARLHGPLEIGPGCRIGESCQVERSMLGAGVVLEDGARVRDSLLGDGVRVETGEVLDSAVAAVVDGRCQVELWKENCGR